MSQKVIDALNRGRERELHAILQYMAEHYELEDAGYGKLGDRIKEIAITEMKHAEDLAERILFLGGTPASKPGGAVKRGLDIPGMTKVNVELEAGAIQMYNDAAKLCAAEGDHVSKDLFETLLRDEEGHFDEFQKTLEHVQKLGDVYITTLVD